MSLSTLRHFEIFNPKENDTGVTIIGAGAIGSRVFATLVELGLNKITVYDPDIVEAHNLANQLFATSDIGNAKVDGLYTWAQNKLGHNPDTMSFWFKSVNRETSIKGTVFLLVDSLETRRELATSFKNNLNIPRVIDVRMAATHGNIYTFSPHSQLDKYLATLGEDEHAEVSACGSPYSVAPTAAIMANMAVWQFIHAKTNPEAGDEIVDVYLKPFIVVTRKLS
jgi:molybdopterin/thiamine biosynthesis adenylyltransferase